MKEVVHEASISPETFLRPWNVKNTGGTFWFQQTCPILGTVSQSKVLRYSPVCVRRSVLFTFLTTHSDRLSYMYANLKVSSHRRQWMWMSTPATHWFLDIDYKSLIKVVNARSGSRRCHCENIRAGRKWPQNWLISWIDCFTQWHRFRN